MLATVNHLYVFWKVLDLTKQINLSLFELLLLPILQLRIHKTIFFLSYDTNILYSFIGRDFIKKPKKLRKLQVNYVLT